jgi:hypothetical protein
MPHTTSKGKNVYSVDLMFAYINIFKPEIHKINLDSVNYDVNAKGWGDGNISVNDVLQNPKKYKDKLTPYSKVKLCKFLNSFNNRRLLFLGLGPLDGNRSDFIHILIVFSLIKGISIPL